MTETPIPMHWQGMQVQISEWLPIVPSLEEDVVRQVRHGLADVLEWLGEEVGPEPGDACHAVLIKEILYVSRQVYWRLLSERVMGNE